MKPKLFCMIAAVVVCFAAPWIADGAEKEDADSLERLRTDIERRLPAGWTATVDPARRESRQSDNESPALVVQSVDKLPVETQFPGAAPGQQPSKESQRIEIILAVRPFMSQADYQQTRVKDEERVKAQADFEQKLRTMSWAYKGAAPIPPSAFQPKDDRERRLVLEYALLWNRTRPEPLPTHFYEHLSLDMTLPLGYSRVTDAAKAKQYDDIVKSLDVLLKLYGKKEQL